MYSKRRLQSSKVMESKPLGYPLITQDFQNTMNKLNAFQRVINCQVPKGEFCINLKMFSKHRCSGSNLPDKKTLFHQIKLFLLQFRKPILIPVFFHLNMNV